jgi:UrcA family protein
MPFVRLSLAAVAATSLSMAFASAPAQAQYADDPPSAYDRPAPAYYPPAPAYAEPGSTVGEVIVVAPYRRSERDRATGAPIERVATSRIVSYADLDLTTDRGVRELHFRVVRAAQDACDSLDRHYNVMDAGDSECVSRAVRDAMHQAPIGYASDAAYEGP